jgi:hypothetical protein
MSDVKNAIRVSVVGSVNWTGHIAQVPAVGERITAHREVHVVTSVHHDLDASRDGQQDAVITVAAL